MAWRWMETVARDGGHGATDGAIGGFFLRQEVCGHGGFEGAVALEETMAFAMAMRTGANFTR